MMTQCTVCKEFKMRIQGPMAGQQYRYRDDKGKSWHRRKCPTCKNAQLYALRQVRKAAQVKSDPVIPGAQHYTVYIARGTKMRDCTVCGRKTVNYQYCPPCHRTKIGQEAATYYGR